MTDLPAILSRLGISESTYRGRIRSGWPIDKAQSIPKHGAWGIGKARATKTPKNYARVYPLTREQREVSQVLRAWK